jgi:type IV secretory pathway VirJ component
MAGGLPAELSSRVRLAALIGPGLNADFEFHLASWIGASSGSGEVPILPEVQKLEGMKILCISSASEQSESVCPRISGQGVRKVILPGGHHFGGDYRGIAELILKEAGL